MWKNIFLYMGSGKSKQNKYLECNANKHSCICDSEIGFKYCKAKLHKCICGAKMSPNCKNILDHIKKATSEKII